MSKDLKKFLQEWLEWAEAGGTGDQFTPITGLCYNCYQWCLAHKLSSPLKELKEIISEEERGDYPFRAYGFGGPYTYGADRANRTMHMNPERLAWVRKQLCKNS